MNLWRRPSGQNIRAVFLARQIRAARRVGAPTGTVFSPVLLLGRYGGTWLSAQLRRIWSRYAGLLAGPVKLGPRPPSRRLMPRFGTGSPGQDSSGLRQGSGRGRG